MYYTPFDSARPKPCCFKTQTAEVVQKYRSHKLVSHTIIHITTLRQNYCKETKNKLNPYVEKEVPILLVAFGVFELVFVRPLLSLSLLAKPS